MATDISHNVIMEETVLPLFLDCFSLDLFHIAVIKGMHEAWRSLNLGQIGSLTA